MSKDLYRVLGVEPTATSEQISKAWKDRAKEFHPDRNKSADAAARFNEAKEAFDVLSKDSDRSLYDLQRAAGVSAPPPRPTKEREREPEWWSDMFRPSSESIYRAPPKDTREVYVDYSLFQDELESLYGERFVYDRHGVPRVARNGVKNPFYSPYRR